MSRWFSLFFECSFVAAQKEDFCLLNKRVQQQPESESKVKTGERANCYKWRQLESAASSSCNLRTQAHTQGRIVCAQTFGRTNKPRRRRRRRQLLARNRPPRLSPEQRRQLRPRNSRPVETTKRNSSAEHSARRARQQNESPPPPAECLSISSVLARARAS